MKEEKTEKSKRPSKLRKTEDWNKKQKTTKALLKQNNVKQVFVVYSSISGKNKIVKKLSSFSSAEFYVAENCHNFKTGLQIKRVYYTKEKNED
jgi:hypothetical protein